MLIPIQPTGTRPPLFLIHGLFGLYTDDQALARALGPEQPLYGITARGFDGLEPPCGSVPEMAALYAEQIRRAFASGPYLIGGLCQGGKVAVEVARILAAQGGQVRPVLLLDPGATPHKKAEGLATIARAEMLAAIREQWLEIARRAVLHHATTMEIPLFDHRDPAQLAIAARVGAATSKAISRFVPEPYSGAAELIVSSRRAPGFFAPDHDWQRLLCGPRTTHVIEGSHAELLHSNGPQVHMLIRFYLDTAQRGQSA